eukprot:11379251-Alexandrium_andersonii.AAC.1
MLPTSFVPCFRRGRRPVKCELRSWRCSPRLASRRWPSADPGIGFSRRARWTCAPAREASRGT